MTHKPSYEELEKRVRELEKEMLIRTRADEALGVSEKRYRSLVETSSDWLWEIDANGRYTYVSSKVREIFGYAPEEVIGRTPFDLMPEEEARRVGAIFAEIAAEQRPFSLIENVNLHRDGRRVVLETSGVPVFGPDGEFIGYRGMDRDITERKRAEEALRESESKYRALVETTNTGFVIVDSEGRVLDANMEYVRLTGHRHLSEILGRSVVEWTADYQKEKNALDVRKFFQEGYARNLEIDYIDSQGKVTPIEINATVVKIRGIPQTLALCRDITERKRAEEALRESEARLKIAMDLAKLVQWEYDVKSGMFSFDEQFYALYGTTSQHEGGPLMSAETYARKFIPPDESHVIAESIAKTLAAKDPNFTNQLEHRIIRADGEERHIIVRYGVVCDQMGRVVKHRGANQDVTERKRAEEALRDSETRLRAITDSARDAILMMDQGGVITYWNPAAERILGYTREEASGRNLHGLIAPQRYHAAHHAAFPGFVETGRGEATGKTLELVARRKHGEEIPVELSLSAVFMNGWQAVGLLRDITERKQAEEKLKESQQRFIDIIDFLPDATLVIDRDGRVLAWNRAIEEMTGVSKKEMIGKGDHACTVPFYGDRRPHLLDLIDTRDEEIESRYQHVTRKGGILYAETYVPCLHGGEGAYVFSTGAPLFDAHGNRVGAIESIRDITEQRQAQEALRRSEEKYRELVENANSIILRMDNLGNVIFINEFAQSFFGYSEEEILGKNVVGTIVPPVETSGRDLRFLIEDIAVNPDRYSANINENMRRCGERVWIAWTNKPIRYENGRVMEVLCVGNDITERKLMEKAVAEAEAKYRDIFENSVTGIYQVGLDGHFLQVNTAIAHILGYDSTEELLSEASNVRHLYVRPERRSELLRLIEEHGSVREFEVEFFKKDKSVVWVSLDIRSVRNSTGGIVYSEGTASDITDRKLLKARLVQAQKMEAIGTLAGGIAHDFNNMLTPIIGYTELSLNMVREDNRLSHNMSQVLLSANRAKDLVRQILTFSRKTEHEQKPVQVSLIIEEALKLLRSSVPSTIDIRQSMHLDAFNSTTMADPTQIHQVLMNLCTNAAHAMRAKGGTLAITLENAEVGKRARRGTPDMEPGTYLKLSVSDTGHGMNETVKQRIFDPYFTTKGPDEGTGLGLTVVYGIVKSLSGAIAITSEPGKGATFDVYLPKAKTIQAPAAELSEPLPTGHGRVLVVDDEKSIVDMVKEMLETLGYEAVPRYSSTDALEAFRARPESFDLVITDMTMPHMTGIDLTKEILMIRPHTPLILCTGFSETVDQNKIKPLGIKKLLMKPVSMRDLAVAVNEILVRDRLLS